MTTTLPETACPDVADRAALRLEGDEAVLADIYQRHGSVVFDVAMRVTGDRSAAEEVTQAVFLDVWRRPERFDPTRGSLRSWLAMLAHHRSVDWVREEAARRRRELRDFETRVAHLPDLEDTVAATLGAER
ncbi:MAG: sigma-70 family RNA polymerase sigma factor, partial [Acidimicrobiales bacterium]